MKRMLGFFALIVCMTGMAGLAQGQETPRDQAKEAFQKGFAHYQAGQYLQAVRELRRAYNIRPVPLVLYYIGKTYQAAELVEEAIAAFQQFLDEARLTEPRRKEAQEAIEALGGTIKTKPSEPDHPVRTPDVRPEEEPKPEPKRIVRRVKPGEIIHEIIEEARPNLPLLIEAELPDDIEWARLYVYYRAPGREEFEKKLMPPGRRGIYSYLIHHSVLKGTSLQYYIEAVGRTGKRIAGSGTATSPNIILLSPEAPMQPGGRMDDSGQDPAVTTKIVKGVSVPIERPDEETVRPWRMYGAIALTAATVALAGAGIGLGIQSRYKAQDIADSGTARLPGGGWDFPPFAVFDSSLQDTENKGRSYEVGGIVCLSFAAVAAGGAIYLWLNHFGVFGSKREKAEKSSSVAPIVGRGTAGFTYGLNF